VKPFFFGPSARQIFGAYDAPSVRRGEARGVVVASPVGQEMQRAHRALRRLALHLAAADFHTLRFDYWGTGDSGGETEDAQVDQWLGDIATAIEEMRMLQALRTVSLIGLRLGGALAALAAARRGDVDRLVLWEPAVNGRAWVEEGLASHRAWLDGQLVRSTSAGAGDGPVEMVGFPLTATLRAGIEAIDLLALPAPPAARVLVVQRAPTREGGELCRHLARLGAAVDHEHIQEPAIWLRRDMDQATVPPRTLERVVTWLDRP
jgi:pimeloyl-ACP methyl ester carboxylesterase